MLVTEGKEEGEYQPEIEKRVLLLAFLPSLCFLSRVHSGHLSIMDLRKLPPTLLQQVSIVWEAKSQACLLPRTDQEGGRRVSSSWAEGEVKADLLSCPKLSNDTIS